MRVAIIGGGVIGLATAWQAARDGHEVELFERGALPNRGGTSFDEHRLCRIPYGDQAGYCARMPDAYSAWERVWEALGAQHYAETGCLALSTSEGDWTERSRATMARLGMAHDVLDRSTLAARFPMLRVDDTRYGLWTEPGGVLFADRIVEGFVALARDAGAHLHADCSATAIDAQAGRVRFAEGATISADAIIVTAGAWSSALAPWIAVKPTALRQVVAYVSPPPSLAEAWTHAPIMLDLGGPRGMFLAPPVAGRRMKLGCGALNAPGDPGSGVEPRAEDGKAVLAAYRDRLARFAEFRLVEPRICFYANTPDQVFVAERMGRAVVFTGCSGHAFKFAPLIAASLVDSLAHGDAALAWMRGQTPGV